MPQNAHLLQQNKIDFNSDLSITRKGEILDGLDAIIIQKPNSKILGIPLKLHLYNLSSRHTYTDTGYTLPKSKIAEPPVLYDSSKALLSSASMQNYLFNKGYFNARVKDTVHYKGRKANVTYHIYTGTNFLIRDVKLDVEDSTIKHIIAQGMNNTKLTRGAEFSIGLAQEERIRIAEDIRNHGYYRFSQSNIVNIEVDTLNRDTIAERLNFFERVINAIVLRKRNYRPTLDAKIIVRANDDPKAYEVYRIGSVQVYPDYVDRLDADNPHLYSSKIDSVLFRYHKRYIREKAILDQLFTMPGDFYAQSNYDKTINKLNELGIFSYVRMALVEDSSNNNNLLKAYLMLNPAQRYDFNTNFELSTGNQFTQTLNVGSTLSFGVRDKNWLRSANQLYIQAFGGIDLGYSSDSGKNFIQHFYAITRNLGISASLSFPRFISPFFKNRFVKSNQPTTVITTSASMLDRINFFRILSFNSNLLYRWSNKQNQQFELAPLFGNVMLLPRAEDTFKTILKENEFLRNTYQETFILGENIAFIFSNQIQRPHNNYTYARIMLEEAGAYLTAADAFVKSRFPVKYAQYVKLDADVRHYLRARNSLGVLRFFTGIGVPYNQSTTLPYIKQYFAGGPYSVRGWRVRQLGPGGYADTANNLNANTFIDRTGDIKIEANIEYRFDMVQLFSGALKINGAAFLDAGNMWLFRKSAQYPNGEFRFKNLYRQLPISTGLGIRLDVGGFFLIRTDVGFPIKKPYVIENDGWVLDKIQMDKKLWWKNEPVLQFAIGYPF